MNRVPGALSVVRVAFWARLEKLLLRDDMYLESLESRLGFE